ncbi:MAG: transposase, partial [Verrucomicrobiota bacterium]
AEIWHQEIGWKDARRLVLIRHRVCEKKRPGGKKLIDVEGYTFQAFVTNLPATVDAITVWRDYNPRAGCEGVIKQLDMDFALDKLCLKKFSATEAAMSLAVMAYNLCVLFQRHLGWMTGLRRRPCASGSLPLGGSSATRADAPPSGLPCRRNKGIGGGIFTRNF